LPHNAFAGLLGAKCALLIGGGLIPSMPNQTMNNVLQQYRYDGKRYWFRDPKGVWHTASPGSMTMFLMVDLNVSRREAIRVRDSLKTASKEINDPEWAEQSRWLDFTRGSQLYVFLDKVHFCDPYSGRCKRSMKIRDFNKKLRKDFPNKGQVADGGPGAILLL
jgi:hypothetical protein